MLYVYIRICIHIYICMCICIRFTYCLSFVVKNFCYLASLLSFHEKRFVVTSYYKLPSIHVQKFTKNFGNCKSIGEKCKSFFITNNKQYMILLYSCTYVVYRTKLLWQITLVDFGIYDLSA